MQQTGGSYQYSCQKHVYKLVKFQYKLANPQNLGIAEQLG